MSLLWGFIYYFYSRGNYLFYRANLPPVPIRYESKYSIVKQAKIADAKIKIKALAKGGKVEGINLFYRSLHTNKRFHY